MIFGITISDSWKHQYVTEISLQKLRDCTQRIKQLLIFIHRVPTQVLR